MVKRIICVLFCFAMLLSAACVGDEKQGYTVDSTLKTAVAAYNETAVLSTAFAFDLKKTAADESLMFTQGTLNYSYADKLGLSGRITQVKGGNGTTSDVYYKAGAYYSDNGTGKYYMVMEESELLDTYFCGDIPVPKDEELTGFRKAQTGGGTKYVYTASKSDHLYLFGEVLYSSCGLRKPVRSKTECGKTEYSYVVDEDAKLKSFKITTTVTLVDTAPYYPSYSVPQSELTASFDISLEINVKATGDAVKIEVPETKDFVFLG